MAILRFSGCRSRDPAGLFGAVIAFLVYCLPARAHVVSQLYSEFHQTEQAWELEVLFDAGYADPAMRGDPGAAQPTRSWLVALAPAEQTRLTDGALRYLEEILTLTTDGRRVSCEVSFPDFDRQPPDFPKLLNDGAYFHVLLRSDRRVGGHFGLQLAAGDHPDLVVRMPDVGDPRYLTVKPGNSVTLIEAGDPVEGRHPVPAAFVQGFLHVVPAGLDHILFVLAIFLLRRHWKPLLSQSLAFTVAHTITLGLATAGKIRVPSEIVEPLIALSISALAVENLFVRETKPWRLWLVFGFGLVHGLGFASVLSGWIGRDGWFLPTLVAANLGVEAGQLAVLAAAWMLTWRWHQRAAWDHARRWACVGLAVTGLLWFAERTGLLSVVTA